MNSQQHAISYAITTKIVTMFQNYTYKKNLNGTMFKGKECELEPRVIALVGEITAANHSK